MAGNSTESADDGWMTPQGWQIHGWVCPWDEGEYLQVESELTWGEDIYVPCQEGRLTPRSPQGPIGEGEEEHEELLTRSLDTYAHIWREMAKR